MLVHNSYGKSRVRLTKVTRHADRHELAELDVAIELEGDFAESYTHGDNLKIIATDSMKNTVYVLARQHELASCEEFGIALARHFVDRYPQVAGSTVRISQAGWQRIEVDGEPHKHSFVSAGNEQRTCTVSAVRDSVTRVTGGITDLLVLKTTDSLFKDFVTDEFRTLPDADDRIFATSITAEWKVGTIELDWNAQYSAARTAILRTFAMHRSLAVQQTLLEMGRAVLADCPGVDQITLTLPNQHRIPFNLTPLGFDNPNMIFVTTSEPYGLIRGTIERER